MQKRSQITPFTTKRLSILPLLLCLLLGLGREAGAQTVITQDNFSGTAGTALTSHSANTPASAWANNTAYPSVLVLDGSGNVYSTTTTDSIAVAPGTETSQTYYVQGTLTYHGTITGSNALGLVFQQSASTLQNYDFGYSTVVGGWSLVKHSSSGGTTTGLTGTTSNTTSLASGQSYPIVVAYAASGGTATIKCYLNNSSTPLFTVTDTAPWASNGLTGIESYGADTATNNLSVSAFKVVMGVYTPPTYPLIISDGDSVVQGVNGVVSHVQQYQSLLSSTYGITATVVNDGVAGQTTYQCLWGASGSPASPGADGLDQQILAQNPDVVTFQACLLNDAPWIAANGIPAYQGVIRTYINKCLAKTGPSGRPVQVLLNTDNFGGTLSGVRPAATQDATHLACMQVFNEYSNNPNVLIFDTYKYPRSLGVDSASLYSALQSDHNHPASGLYSSFLGATLQPLANVCVTVATASDATVPNPASVILSGTKRRIQ